MNDGLAGVLEKGDQQYDNGRFWPQNTRRGMPGRLYEVWKVPDFGHHAAPVGSVHFCARLCPNGAERLLNLAKVPPEDSRT